MTEKTKGRNSVRGLIERPRSIVENRLFRRQMSLRYATEAPEININADEKLAVTHKTYVVIVFSEKTKQSICEDVEKIIKELGMLTTLEIISKTEKYLYISASTDKLLKLADEAELTKKTITGSMQKFNYFSKSDFLVGNMTENDIVRNSEAPVLVKDAIKPSLLYYIRNGSIEDFFPLHDIVYLEQFSFKFGKQIDVEAIRNYYGTSIGLYFAFIQFYTTALIFPCFYGILQYFYNFNLGTVCGIYVIWTTVFLELWKRRCSGLAYRWGTIEMSSLDKPRTAYFGVLKPDPITGKMTLSYPMRFTYIQMYCVSYPVVFLCVLAAAYFALYQFQIEAEVLHDFGPDSLLLYIPVIVQSILISIFSWAYEKLATFLTDQENHRTRSQFDRHRVNKLMIFEIVNNFFSLFYIAFVLQDLKQLKYQLMMQLMIFQLVCMAQEVGIPLLAVIKLKFTKFMHKELDDTKKALIKDLPRYEQSFFESGLDKYCSTYEDYLQMCIQFGYVVLFAAVAPFAALGALINNLFAMYIDIFKLCNIFKRPFARRAKNIGAWQSGFEILSVMAILSNCGLLYLQPNVREFVRNHFSNISMLSFVVFEHLLLAIKFCIHKAIHERPRWVRIALLKADYESSLAYKHLRKFKSLEKAENKID